MTQPESGGLPNDCPVRAAQAAACFMRAWTDGDWASMAIATTPRWRTVNGRAMEAVEEMFGHERPSMWRVMGAELAGLLVPMPMTWADVTVRVVFTRNGKRYIEKRRLRVLPEDVYGIPEPLWPPGCVIGVNPLSALAKI